MRGRPAEAQLAGLSAAPTHAYYFATPTIFRAQSALFARARLDAFLDVYVDGFLRLAQALRARRNDVSLFYPSSVYVAERPRGMVEYAMAKAAGETLCSEMNLAWAPLRVAVVRLPRLPTDQTASVMEAALPSPVACLLPAVREAQSWPRRAKNEISQQADPHHARAEPWNPYDRGKLEAGWVRPRRIDRSKGGGQRVRFRLPQQDRRQCCLIRMNSCWFFFLRPFLASICSAASLVERRLSGSSYCRWSSMDGGGRSTS